MKTAIIKATDTVKVLEEIEANIKSIESASRFLKSKGIIVDVKIISTNVQLQ